MGIRSSICAIPQASVLMIQRHDIYRSEECDCGESSYDGRTREGGREGGMKRGREKGRREYGACCHHISSLLVYLAAEVG